LLTRIVRGFKLCASRRESTLCEHNGKNKLIALFEGLQIT
jgi:hypothetical protein